MTDAPAVPPIPRRSEVLAQHKAAGGLAAAVFPGHHPRALLRAFGVLPVEVWGPPGADTTAGDAHLQAYTCPIVRAGLAFALSEAVSAVDMLVVPHTCDSTQGLGALMLDLVRPSRPVLPFYLPRGEGESAVDFLADEIRALHRSLARICGREPSAEALAEAVRAEEEADARFARLLVDRPRIALPDGDFYRVLRSREYLPTARFVAIADSVIAGAPGAPAGVPLLASGMVPEPRGLFDVISRAGAFVAADDYTCTGRRSYRPGIAADPHLRMAESLLSAPPDATRGAPVRARAEHLLALAKRSGARAALFHEVKFCEPEQFYVPQLRRALEEAGLRTLVLETDPVAPLPDQAVTRVEALLETLR